LFTSISNYSLFFTLFTSISKFYINYHILFLLFNNNIVNVNYKSQILKIDNLFFLFSFLLFFSFLFFLLLFLSSTPKRATALFSFSLLTKLSSWLQETPILMVYYAAGKIETGTAAAANRTRRRRCRLPQVLFASM
jgi:hypothetical protein